MNKNAIKIAIIVISFSASGLVLYFGMFKNSARPQSGQLGLLRGEFGEGGVAGGGAELLEGQILPNGDSLEFKKVINDRRFEYYVVTYPKLNPATEVGIEESNLIAPVVVEEEPETQ